MKNKTHIYRDSLNNDYKLNYSEIIKELIKKWILDKSLLNNNWIPDFKEIFIFLDSNRDKFVDKSINLNIELDEKRLQDNYISSRFQERFNIRQLHLDSVNTDEIFEILKKIYLLNYNIEQALFRAFSDRRMIWFWKEFFEIVFDDNELMDFYLLIKKNILSRQFDEKIIYKIINRYDFKRVLQKLESIFTSKKIQIHIDTKYFVSKFLEKIDVFSEYTSKEDDENIAFIDKFKLTRDKKIELAEKYYNLWLKLLSWVIIINLLLYFLNIWNKESFEDFILWFLWNWIFLFIVELILFTIGIYCFKLYNFYSKLVELYDSHIWLIESDLHYKNDEQLINWGIDSVFTLRKENTQKIHNLPDKALNLLNLKTDINTHSDFSIKIIEKLIDKIN